MARDKNMPEMFEAFRRARGEQARRLEEAKAAEKREAERKLSEERLAEERLAAQKLAEERAAQHRIEQQRLSEERAAEEKKQIEARTAEEKRRTEARTAAEKTVEARVAEPKPTVVRPAESRPVEPRVRETRPVDVRPVDTRPTRPGVVSGAGIASYVRRVSALWQKTAPSWLRRLMDSRDVHFLPLGVRPHVVFGLSYNALIVVIMVLVGAAFLLVAGALMIGSHSKPVTPKPPVVRPTVDTGRGGMPTRGGTA